MRRAVHPRSDDLPCPRVPAGAPGEVLAERRAARAETPQASADVAVLEAVALQQHPRVMAGRACQGIVDAERAQPFAARTSLDCPSSACPRRTGLSSAAAVAASTRNSVSVTTSGQHGTNPGNVRTDPILGRVEDVNELFGQGGSQSGRFRRRSAGRCRTSRRARPTRRRSRPPARAWPRCRRASRRCGAARS